MKKSALILAVLAAAACTKESRDGFVTYRAECDSCVVEWFDDGAWRADTVLRHVVRSGEGWDTLNGTAAYHIMAKDGDRLRVNARGNEVSVAIDGDFGRFNSEGDSAAHLDVLAH